MEINRAIHPCQRRRYAHTSRGVLADLETTATILMRNPRWLVSFSLMERAGTGTYANSIMIVREPRRRTILSNQNGEDVPTRVAPAPQQHLSLADTFWNVDVGKGMLALLPTSEQCHPHRHFRHQPRRLCRLANFSSKAVVTKERHVHSIIPETPTVSDLLPAQSSHRIPALHLRWETNHTKNTSVVIPHRCVYHRQLDSINA
jgi:hypothetical protein